MNSEQLYELVTSADPSEIENLIVRLFREYFLEDPDQSEQFLNRLREVADDPVLRSMAYAPDDDEPLTDEDLQAIEEALNEMESGDVVSHEHSTQ